MNRERELIADIQARRDYIKYSNLTLTEKQAQQRQIKAWERELVALGGTVPAEAPKPTPSTGDAAIYHASRRVQLDSEGYVTNEPNPNAFHEDRGDGTPLCGQHVIDYWTDSKTGIRYRSIWTRHGSGPVSCGRCANISGAPRGYEPLAEPQGDSVRTVSGGGFEMNRSRH